MASARRSQCFDWLAAPLLHSLPDAGPRPYWKEVDVSSSLTGMNREITLRSVTVLAAEARNTGDQLDGSCDLNGARN